MIEITILSGKGGTGKTSIAAAFASLSGNAVFCDNDVDAPDLHLILKPVIKEEHTFSSGKKAVIVADKCSGCGICSTYCRFGAIHITPAGIPEINPIHCEGCGLCSHICPEEAIRMDEFFNNRWFISDTRFGHLIYARMGAGEENSGKLVTQLRLKAREIAEMIKAEYIVSDGPPGIGCPVIASLTGTDIVLLVTEPTLAGLHDAIRLSSLVRSLKLPLFVIINKFNLNPAVTIRIENHFKETDTYIAGKIAFDAGMVKAMVAGKSIIEYAPGSQAGMAISSVWKNLINFPHQKSEAVAKSV